MLINYFLGSLWLCISLLLYPQNKVFLNLFYYIGKKIYCIKFLPIQNEKSAGRAGNLGKEEGSDKIACLRTEVFLVNIFVSKAIVQ